MNEEACNERHKALNGWIAKLEKRVDTMERKIDKTMLLLVGNLVGIIILLLQNVLK